MAHIRMQKDDVKAAVSGIEEDISQYRQLGREIRQMMSALTCWEGDDKDIYCKSVDAALNNFVKLTQAVSEYNKTINLCVSKYDDCCDVTTEKVKTI